MRRVNLSGRTFGRLTVVKMSRVIRGDSKFLCRCSCGVEKEILGTYLTSGDTKSCGCLRSETCRRMGMATRTHGQRILNTRTYRAWKSMIDRCTRKTSRLFPGYGGRGISVCQRWLLFKNFYEDMGDSSEGLQLERLDNDGDYRKDNCCWASRKQQMRNRRVTLYVEWNGKKHALSKLCEEFGIKYQTAYWRHRRNMSIDMVLHKGRTNARV